MNTRDFDNFSQIFGNWKKILINFDLQRDLFNKELENYIKNIGIIEKEIYNSLFSARAFYSKNRNKYGQKIKNLKTKRNEFKDFLEYFKKEITTLSEPKLINETNVSIQIVESSISDIETEIYNITKKLDNEPLNIVQENKLIERIQTLEKDKDEHLSNLKKLEQNLKKEYQSNIYFRTLKAIEILEVNLKEINKSLRKWYNKQLETHKKMLELYRKVREFEIIQKQMENQLFKNIELANYYHRVFSEMNFHNKKQILEEQLKKFRVMEERTKELIRKEEKIQKPHIKEIIKRKKTQKKHMKKKLAIALDKKKTGKKLEFHELKLILDHSKK